MNSMTGFGRAARAGRDFDVEVEAKSVNHRFLSVKVSLPSELSRYEADVDRLVRGALGRGSVGVSVTLRRRAGDRLSLPDPARLKAAYKGLDKVRRDLGLKEPLRFEAVAALPQVWESPGDEAPAEKVWAVAGKLVDKALADLVKMREGEGRKIREDVLARLDLISAAADRIRARAPRVMENYQRKLEERVAALGAAKGLDLAKADLVKEIAVFADKCDISEELQRLTAHVAGVRAVFEAGGPLGRRLDFLTQEMVRETNTMASKAGDAEISSAAVAVKAELEKIKEQSENLE